MEISNGVQKIKERLGIEEVVSSYVKLERAGANRKAKCPFHNEKTPSFFISPDRGTYYCFGCGASGDIFSFVEEFEGLDFKGALRLLAERAGVELGNYNREAEGEKEKLYRVMAEASSRFTANLEDEKEVGEYLRQRGLAEKTVGDFRIGFAKADWRDLYSHLKKAGFADSVIEKAGLAKKTEKGFYDRFRGRIMFPIWDSSGRVIAFSGRIFKDDGTSAKYVNSPETPIFHKSSVLYGIDRAKESIRKNNFSILVEGQMDLIMSHQAGYRNTVAASGTAFSDQTLSGDYAVTNIGLIRRLSPNIVLALDGDAAGLAATLRAGRVALALGMDVKVAGLPAGSDPADLIRNGGADAWREAIRRSVHIVEFMLRNSIEVHAEDMRKAGREIREKVLPLVAAIESSIEQAHFLKKISELSGIPEKALEDDFKKVGTDAKRGAEELKNIQTAESSLYRKDYILRRLLGLVLWQRTKPEKIPDADRLLGELGEILSVPGKTLLEEATDRAEDLIFEAEVFYSDVADATRDADEMLLNLKEETLKEKLAQKMKDLYRAEAEKDKEKSGAIFKECQELNQKIQDIKNGRLKS